MNIIFLIILTILSPCYADYETTAAEMALANAEPGPRQVPSNTLPIPTCEVSPEVQAMIGTPYFPIFNIHPKSPSEWKELVENFAKQSIDKVTALKEKFNVSITSVEIAGVMANIVEPATLPDKNKNRLLIHIHGGGYVLGPGEAGLGEAVLMAGFCNYKVLSIDYRMPPDFPYPAALDDAMAVWKELVKTISPKNMAIYGSSAGGGLALAMILRAKDEGLPLPSAIAPGTPWSDLTDTGDSYKTNEWIDNILVSWNGWVSDAARLYAGEYDLKHPYLSPVYGNYEGFPPTILTSGTRDLFLSNTVRVHRKLRRAGIEADLNVYEGQAHGYYTFDENAPEAKEVFTEIGTFFDKHLGN